LAYVTTTVDYFAIDEQGAGVFRFQDLWWSGPLENGWGMSIAQHRGRLFTVLFVYDNQGDPTWYVAPGGYWANNVPSGWQFSGPIYSPRGTPWFAYDASRLDVGPLVANASLSFASEQQGSVSLYDGITWTRKTIVRQDFRAARTSPVQGVGDMWWGGPQQNGWGIAVLEQQGSLFSVWFTYDDSGAPTWFVMPVGDWTDSRTFAGTIYRTHGSPWLGATYDAALLRVDAVGHFAFHFDVPDRATFEYDVDGQKGVLNLERQPF
jgi:hypothetical protein